MDAKKVAKLKKTILEKLGWLKVLVFLVILAYCGYLWYILIYNSQLGNDDKQAYISTKEKEVEFNQKGFALALEQVEQKKARYATPMENIIDIFKLRQ